MTVKFITMHLPRTGDGASAYILAILRHLREQGFALEVICLNDAPSGSRLPWYHLDPQLPPLGRVRVRRHLVLGTWCVRPWPLTDWLRAVASRLVPAQLKERRRPHTATVNARTIGLSDAELIFARRALADARPTAVIANYASTAEALDAAPPGTLKLVLTHDVQHLRTASFAAHGLEPESRLSRDEEVALLARGDVLIAIQDEDAQQLRKLAPHAEIITVPHPVTPQPVTGPQIPGRCLFVGSDAPHNVDGLRWLLTEIWPRVLAAVPEATLEVVGDVTAMVSGEFPRVKMRGRATALESFYSAAEVCLVPNRAGSGLKIKLIEALAHGRTCVTTNAGLQGVRELAGRAVLAAETSAEFASAMTRLLNDAESRRRLEGEAQRFVTERLAPEVVCRPLVDRLRGVGLAAPKSEGTESGGFSTAT